MALESFYGGRQGAAFVIVQRFDGINIPQPGDGSGVTEYTYTQTAYAIDTDQKFITTTDATVDGVEVATGIYLIAKTSGNYKDYDWQLQKNDGSTFTTAEGETYNFPTALAQGMVQCFSQGVRSSSLVNYGEYVIIDTIANLGVKNDPDNGKVFRRGMNIENEYAGGEYIGQIVGPQGETPELDILTYTELNEVDDQGNYKHIHQNKSYNALNDGIVPGSYVQNGVRFYEDEIRYAYGTVKDTFGNVQGCTFGFKFPTLIQDFEAQSMSPYEQRSLGGDGKYYNHDLIKEDESQFIDGKWQHPFYQKWQIKVPHGYHGINSTNIEIIPTHTMPSHFKGAEYPGAALYVDKELTTPYTDNNGIPVVLSESWEIERDAKYDNSDDVLWAIVTYDNQDLYVKKEDCYMNVMRYRETDFDNIESGEVKYIEIGDYNTIERVTISADGALTVFYSAESQPRQLEQVLRWIDTKDTDGITIDDDGSLHIYYNTLHEDEETGKMVHDHQDYPTVLDWITNVTLNQTGEFTVLYNNNTMKVGEDAEGNPIYGDRYSTTLQWVDRVILAEDGTVSFYFNTDHENAAFTFEKKIKYLTDVQVNTADESGEEGTGDQRIHLTYNTTDSDGHNIEDAIGEPLNYIIETCISIPTLTYPNAPYSHLLVYYSDPALREKYRDKWVTYPSTKFYTENDKGKRTYKILKQWVDLGGVRGQAGGLHILKNVDSLDELMQDGEYIPPEKIEINGEVATYAAGWGVTLSVTGGQDARQLLFYDYEHKIWYSIGTIDSAAVEPRYIIAKSTPTEDSVPAAGDADDLKANGFWLAAERGYYAF